MYDLSIVLSILVVTIVVAIPILIGVAVRTELIAAAAWRKQVVHIRMAQLKRLGGKRRVRTSVESGPEVHKAA